jgi:hypothetical protein
MMEITERREGNVLVLELMGRMTIGEGDGDAGDAIRQKIGAGERELLLDMRDVAVLDSSRWPSGRVALSSF